MFKILPTPLISVDYFVPHPKWGVSTLWKQNKTRKSDKLEIVGLNDKKKGWFLTKFENRRNNGGWKGRRGRITVLKLSESWEG